MRKTITGEREARLTFRGATSARRHEGRVLVVDIGGGSTEFVVGTDGEVDFHVSTQLGSVRHTERILHSDPPTEDELEDCKREIRGEIERSVPAEVRRDTARRDRRRGYPNPVRRDRPAARAIRPRTRRRLPPVALRLRANPGTARVQLRSTSGARSRACTPTARPTIVAGGVILDGDDAGVRARLDRGLRARHPRRRGARSRGRRSLDLRVQAVICGKDAGATLSRSDACGLLPLRERAFTGPFPYIGSSEAGCIGASRRSDRMRPHTARTPARPVGAFGGGGRQEAGRLFTTTTTTEDSLLCKRWSQLRPGSRCADKRPTDRSTR